MNSDEITLISCNSHPRIKKNLDHTIYGYAGIIFVSVEDPYSRIVKSISKCEYSAIGFYAPSTSTGVRKIIVTLVDLFGVEKPTWLSSGCTLEKLITNPLITRLAIKPLKISTTDEREINSAQSKFRACICRGVELVKKPTSEETIFSLFGYQSPDKSQHCVTGIDFVNQVISLYGAFDKIQPGSTISLTALEELRKVKSNPDQLSVISMMGLPFGNGEESIDISSYIVNNSLFDDLVEIPLPQHSQHLVEQEKKKMLNLYRPHLIDGMKTFIELLLTHPDFFNTVLKRMKAGQKISETSDKILLETLISCNAVTDETLSLLSKLAGGQGVERKEIKAIHHKLEKEYYTSCLFIGKEPILHYEEVADVDSTASAIEELKSWTQQLIKAAGRSETYSHPVCVDMGHLVSLVNQITSSKLNLPSVNHQTPAMLYWNNNSSEYCQKLGNGKTLYLNRYTPHLDSLTSDELIEISEQLSSLDDNYESLREAVADQLSSLHDVDEF